MSKSLVRMSEAQLTAAKAIDEIASGAMEVFKDAGSFTQELQVAQATNDLRLALTDEMMKPIMALMNTDLGFRTDRDPKVTPLERDGKTPMTPYSMDVVRDCVIEAKLRGFHVVGNEFNVIASRFYACKNGLKRQVEKWAGVTDVKVDYGIPKAAGEKGAIVPVKARWIRDGVKDGIEAEIPVRVNSGMGADAIIGKAERKIYKRIHDRLSGIITPDGEAHEDVEVVSSSPKPEPRFDNAKSATVSEVKTVEAEPIVASTSTSPEKPKSTRANRPTMVEEQLFPSPQMHLEQILKAEGFTFADFVQWGGVSGNFVPEQGIDSFAKFSNAFAARWIGAKGGLIQELKKMKGAK